MWLFAYSWKADCRPSIRSLSLTSLSCWVPPLDLLIQPAFDRSTLLTFLCVLLSPGFKWTKLLFPVPAFTILIVLASWREEVAWSARLESLSVGRSSSCAPSISLLIGFIPELTCVVMTCLVWPPRSTAGGSGLTCCDGVALLTNLCFSIFCECRMELVAG